MKSQYFILLLVVFFITSTNAAQLRASALRKSIDLDDVKVDTEKEPTDAMTDSSTEESATELEARMAKQTPDTEEEAKILTKRTADDHCLNALTTFRACSKQVYENSEQKRVKCQPLAKKYMDCRANTCKEERIELVTCIKDGIKLSRNNVTKWQTTQRHKCQKVLEIYNQCRKPLAMDAVMLPINPFLKKNIGAVETVLNNIKNPVEQQSPEDEAEYIQNLYSYKQPDANADESDDIDRRTSLDNAFDSNIEEPTKKEQKKISNNYDHEYAKEIKECHKSPLTKWCKVTSLCISVHQKCLSKSKYGPNHNIEDNSKYDHSKAANLLKQFKKVHQLLEHQKEGSNYNGKLPAHVDDEDNSKLLSKPGIQLKETNGTNANVMSVRSFRPANLNDTKFNKQWVNKSVEKWIKYEMKDLPYRKFVEWEPNMDKTRPLGSKAPSFKLLEDTTATGYVNTLTIGSGHHPLSHVGSGRKKATLILPEAAKYKVDKTLLALGDMKIVDPLNRLDSMFEATIKKYKKERNAEKVTVNKTLDRNIIKQYKSELNDAIKNMNKEAHAYQLEKITYEIKYGTIYKKRGEVGFKYILHEKLNQAADRLKKTRDIVKAIRKKIRDEITHHIQKHLGTEKEASTTHAAEATISDGTTVNDHHGTTVTTVNDHSKKAKDDAWERYMERKRLEGKKAWSKERWSKNYDQLEKARAKRLEAMSA